MKLVFSGRRLPMSKKPDPASGLAHLIAATGYSLAGMRVLWREASFRQEAVGGAAGVLLLFWFGAQPSSIAVFVILLLVLFSVEALNTAIEGIVDHLSPDWSPFGKQVKDLGSAAVFFLLVANAVYLVVTLWPLVLHSD